MMKLRQLKPSKKLGNIVKLKKLLKKCHPPTNKRKLALIQPQLEHTNSNKLDSRKKTAIQEIIAQLIDIRPGIPQVEQEENLEQVINKIQSLTRAIDKSRNSHQYRKLAINDKLKGH